MMRKSHIAIAATLVAAFLAGHSEGAILEWELHHQVYNTVAVLRHLHREITQIEEKYTMVRNTMELTTTQHAAQAQLVEEERARLEAATTDEERERHEIRLEVFMVDMRRLEDAVEVLHRFDLLENYRARVDFLRERIRRYEIQLEAKLLQSRVHFGFEPPVSLDFEAEVSRFWVRELDITYLTIR